MWCLYTKLFEVSSYVYEVSLLQGEEGMQAKWFRQVVVSCVLGGVYALNVGCTTLTVCDEVVRSEGGETLCVRE